MGVAWCRPTIQIFDVGFKPGGNIMIHPYCAGWANCLNQQAEGFFGLMKQILIILIAFAFLNDSFSIYNDEIY
jgi:hypothetical protein